MSSSAHKSSGIRWAVNVAQWNPKSEEWEKLLGLLAPVEPEEVQRINKFHFRVDAKRALVGRLLMRHLVHTEKGVPWHDIKLRRSKYNKPYWDAKSKASDSSAAFVSERASGASKMDPKTDVDPDADSSLLKFNVSHHGDWVVCASEGTRLIGCDVMSIEIPGADKNLGNFFKDMLPLFSDPECRLIRSRKTERLQLSQFYSLWCLKEAFIKAIGTGLGFDLKRAEFYYLDPSQTSEFSPMGLHILDISVVATPSTLPDPPHTRIPFRFEHCLLDSEHITAVCVEVSPGGVESKETKPAVASLSASPAGASTTTTASTSTSTATATAAPSHNWTILSVADLLPRELRVSAIS